MVAIALREDDIVKYFKFEMSPYPPSLFKDGLMRKANKPALRKVLLHDESAIEIDDYQQCSYVLDGGALLHRVRWLNGSTFKELAKCYVEYVRRHYVSATIVFDGYKSRTSTKSNEHARRHGNDTQNVVVMENNTFPLS